uniref:Uncharacterized protein n=1 Tax=Tetranychus urticae TaxID=32264 RepID=T1L4Y9_TETUR
MPPLLHVIIVYPISSNSQVILICKHSL